MLYLSGLTLHLLAKLSSYEISKGIHWLANVATKSRIFFLKYIYIYKASLLSIQPFKKNSAAGILLSSGGFVLYDKLQPQVNLAMSFQSFGGIYVCVCQQ